MYDKEGSMVLP